MAGEFSIHEGSRGFGSHLTRLEQAAEVVIFLLFIVPSMALAYFITESGQASFTILALSTILRDISLVALIIFFLWRNGEHDERIGWTFHNFWIDLLIGLLLFFPLAISAAFLDILLRRLGVGGPPPTSGNMFALHSETEVLLAIILVIVVAVAEETIFRGYLIRRLTAVFGNTALAVIAAVIIFALGHGYEGASGVITVGYLGLVYALIFLWRKSLVAPVVMHFLQDFVAIVVSSLVLPR